MRTLRILNGGLVYIRSVFLQIASCDDSFNFNKDFVELGMGRVHINNACNSRYSVLQAKLARFSIKTKHFR